MRRTRSTTALFVLTVLAVLVGACGAGGAGTSDGTEPGRGGPAAEAPDGEGAATGDPVVPGSRDLSPYEGLGAWVDAFDYAPAYQADGGGPSVVPDAIDDMARLGVDTVFIQAARDDDRSPEPLVDEELLTEFVHRAHDAGLAIVAWFLPKHADVDADVEQIRYLLEWEADGHHFDGVVLNIEWPNDVPDVGERNRRVVETAERAAELAGDDPLGAVVLEPVLLEVINENFWPDFPWRRLADHIDVWMPMSYWTNRASDSRYRDGYVYTDENIRRMWANLGVETPVHPVGGIGNRARPDDYRGFVRAAREHGAIGWSIYDYDTQSSASWPHLRGP